MATHEPVGQGESKVPPPTPRQRKLLLHICPTLAAPTPNPPPWTGLGKYRAEECPCSSPGAETWVGLRTKPEEKGSFPHLCSAAQAQGQSCANELEMPVPVLGLAAPC